MRTRRAVFFNILKGFSVSKNCLRLESARLMLWDATSWSHLRLLQSLKVVQIQLALHPCDPSLISYCNVTVNIVEKCFVVCGMLFKTFIDFKTYCILLLPHHLRYFCTSYQRKYNVRTRTGSLKPYFSYLFLQKGNF